MNESKDQALDEPTIRLGDGAGERAWILDAIASHENALLRYAQHFLGDLDRGRDVVQDTFLQLVRQPAEKLETEIRPFLKRWLFKVCRNRAIDVSRKENRMKLTPTDQLAEEIAEPKPTLHPQSSGPEAAAQTREESDSIGRRISNLSENQQEVLRLKFHGDLSYKEIAKVTGLTISNVGFLLHSAIGKLRQQVVSPAD